MSATAGIGDARFFNRAGPFSVAHLAEAAGATPPASPELQSRLLTGVAPLQNATPSQLSVLHNSKYVAELAATQAGAVLVAAAQAARVPAGCVALIVRDPHAAWAKLAALFHPASPIQPGTHPTAVIDPTADIDPTVEIGPLAVIAAGARIGPRCQIGPAAVIGANVVLGADCRIGAHASLSHAIIGDRVYIYPGARIGQEGFGFAITPAGFLSVPQLGRVVIEDDVEIGANSTIDRGASHDTTIGRGTRIDNLVMVAHNVRIGEHCALASQVGLSGSASVGDFVQLAGQVGIAGHVRIGSRVQLGGQAGVMSDIPDGAIMIGSPAMPVREFFRNVAVLRKLARRGGTDSTGST